VQAAPQQRKGLVQQTCWGKYVENQPTLETRPI
jgi:hypothetical protein